MFSVEWDASYDANTRTPMQTFRKMQTNSDSQLVIYRKACDLHMAFSVLTHSTDKSQIQITTKCNRSRAIVYRTIVSDKNRKNAHHIPDSRTDSLLFILFALAVQAAVATVADR